LHPAVAEGSWMTIDPASGWRKVKSVVDSGASDSVAPVSLAPEIPIRASEGSRRGQTYSGAVKGAKELKNLGEKVMTMATSDGTMTQATWQMVDVNRPLTAVRKMCKQGNRVIFGLYGGVIQNVHTGEEVPFNVEDEVYTMDLWLPPATPEGFQGQR
jgi:hypothetical protein